MNVFLLEYQNGLSISIICSSDEHTCNIYCLTHKACTNTTIIDRSIADSSDGIFIAHVCNIYCDTSNGIGCGNIIGDSYNYKIYNLSDISTIEWNIESATTTSISTAIDTTSATTNEVFNLTQETSDIARDIGGVYQQ